MAQLALLDQTAEDKLHSTRLLNIEERPFKRITKRLLAPSNPIAAYLSRTPSHVPPAAPTLSSPPPPISTQNINSNDNDNEETLTTPPPTTLTPSEQSQYLTTLQRLREDTLLDFSSFDSSIARTQFLHRANQKQRARYAAEKVSIQSTSTAVRADMERLKMRLEQAQRTLQTRKGYDVLAERITRDRDLKSREEQTIGIERLRNEIEELEREGVELGMAWRERREQFARVVEEGSRLRRVVRNEPEPEARGEGDEEDGDRDGDGSDDEERRSEGDGDENMLGHEEQRDRDANSNMGTPMMRPAGDGEDAPTPLPGVHESGAMTPRSTMVDAESSTPRPEEKSATREGEDVEMKEGIPDVRIDDMDTT